jgi:hypothetical protein
MPNSDTDLQWCKSTLRDKLWSEDLELTNIIQKCQMHEERIANRSIFDDSSVSVHAVGSRGLQETDVVGLDPVGHSVVLVRTMVDRPLVEGSMVTRVGLQVDVVSMVPVKAVVIMVPVKAVVIAVPVKATLVGLRTELAVTTNVTGAKETSSQKLSSIQCMVKVVISATCIICCRKKKTNKLNQN